MSDEITFRNNELPNPLSIFQQKTAMGIILLTNAMLVSTPSAVPNTDLGPQAFASTLSILDPSDNTVVALNHTITSNNNDVEKTWLGPTKVVCYNVHGLTLIGDVIYCVAQVITGYGSTIGICSVQILDEGYTLTNVATIDSAFVPTNITSDNSTNLYVCVNAESGGTYVYQINVTTGEVSKLLTIANTAPTNSIMYATLNSIEYLFVHLYKLDSSGSPYQLQLMQINISNTSSSTYVYSYGFVVPIYTASISTMIDDNNTLLILVCEDPVYPSIEYQTVLFTFNLNSSNNYLINPQSVFYPSVFTSSANAIVGGVLQSSTIATSDGVCTDVITLLSTVPQLQPVTVTFNNYSISSLFFGPSKYLTCPFATLKTTFDDVYDAYILNTDTSTADVATTDSQPAQGSLVYTGKQLSDGILLPNSQIMIAVISVINEPSLTHSSSQVTNMIRKAMLLAEQQKPSGGRFFKFKFLLSQTDRITGFKNKQKKLTLLYNVANN